MNFVLPWPTKGLNPNARLHYKALWREKKAYREACGWQVKAQGGARIAAESLKVHLVFFPPDRRHRDQDNMIASVKSGLDGLADVLGVDDRRWNLTFEVSEELGGMVRVAVEA